MAAGRCRCRRPCMRSLGSCTLRCSRSTCTRCCPTSKSTSSIDSVRCSSALGPRRQLEIEQGSRRIRLVQFGRLGIRRLIARRDDARLVGALVDDGRGNAVAHGRSFDPHAVVIGDVLSLERAATLVESYSS